jgi:acyl dehydratase
MIDAARLLAWEFEAAVQAYTPRDAAIYALSIGLGADPMDAGQLRHVAPEHRPPAFPTMATVLARNTGFITDPSSGITPGMVVQGEQGLELFQPLPPEGRLRGRSRITDVVDKGAGKGAVIYHETDLLDDTTGALLARRWASAFARGDGGFGGSSAAPRRPHALPDRAPDAVVELPTLPNAALLYRLNGDMTPIHSDPEAARRAGFARPILHGLCTYAVAAHAVIRQFCGYDSTVLRAIDARFSAPLFPGETIAVELWRDGEIVSFRALVRARGARVLDNGRALLGAAPS